MKKIHKTIITTSLPYCLYNVDGRFFKLNDNFDSKIRFSKVETTPNRRTASSKNMETIRDRWGIDAHSKVELYTNKDLLKNEDISEAKVFTITTINQFIKRYRYYADNAIHLGTIIFEDLFDFNIISGGRGCTSTGLAGGIRISNPNTTFEISNKIEESLLKKEEIPLWKELIINAQQHLYQEEYRYSILESVIALEFVISNFIIQKCKQKGISKNESEDYIKSIGLTGNIKITLKFLLGDSELPEEIIFQKCKTAITFRNDIVHKGKKDLVKHNAEEAINYIQKLITFITKTNNYG